jgi:hypothetical protein
MGLWSALKRFWNWLRNGSGYGVEELARRLGWKAANLEAFRPSYREFTVPKRAGGRRRLCAPEEDLKALQRAILHRLLARLKVHLAATGFQPGQSIVTHARRHVGRSVVVRLDVKDFFPATAAGRVHRYFRKIGWNRPAGHADARTTRRLAGPPAHDYGSGPGPGPGRTNPQGRRQGGRRQLRPGPAAGAVNRPACRRRIDR